MRTILPLLFLIFYCTSLWSQKKENKEQTLEYKVTYEMTYQPDSTNVDSKKSEAMVLYFGNGISKFSSLGKAIEDSLMGRRKKGEKSWAEFNRIRSQIPPTQFHYVIYKGIPKNKLTYTQEIVNDKFKYTQDKDIFNWKIEPETKVIAGYSTQRATTNFAGRNYTAWFTGKIPNSDGPYKFNGLPGLIVKIKDEKNHYVFELIKLEKLNKPFPILFEKEEFIDTSQEELRKLKEQYEQDPLAALERSGITIDFEEGVREKLHRENMEEMKKKNNPIELK